ncbi:synaptonemal complex protein 1 [Triplophysa rosa]|uniref:Synaptonemal complex protein 1 n=1 Tax=Triplophysa rosa TaxID=992332 RepID=A0A9W7WS36_TRIRA|nr:synaptonemal complex protein 1 [Triplophysa rosa]
MQKAFNFKLLVPPRAHVNQVSALKPNETGLNEETCVFSQPVQGFNKSSDMEKSLPLTSKMVLPTKTSRTECAKKATVIPMEKEETLRSSQLFSRLLDEAEKIKMWKVRIDSDMSQQDRRLQENRKTIETQRKAIQELQFANESLSMKLEDQLNENEDLKNKSNATRNLCNILKDTFERSVEKMSVFEAEREETHDLFIQNSESIQRMGAAFESLRKQAEANQQDKLKLRECLTQMEGLKMKFESDCLVKEKEVAMLQEKVCEKESNLEDVSLKLLETQQNCNLLKESARQHQELLKNLTLDRETLEEKLKATEQFKWEIEEKQRALTNELEQSKENHVKLLQKKDAELEELNNIKEQQSHQLAEMQLTVKSLQSSLTTETLRTQDLEAKLTSVLNELSYKISELEKIEVQNDSYGKQIQILKDGLDEKSDLLNSVKEKLQTSEIQTLQLIATLEQKACQLKEAVEKDEYLEEALIKARHEFEELQKEVVLKETKVKEIEEHLSGALESGCKSSTKIERLEIDIELQRKKYKELYKELQMQKDTIQEQVDSGVVENKVLQSQLMGKNSKKELQMKDKQIKSLESKLTNLKTKLETKTTAFEECLEDIRTLRDESDNAKKLHNEELQKICSDLKEKSTFEAQLNLEVEKLKQTAMEAMKNKEDTETKCQQRISDMVALMERHKHEYDKMIEEKDAELSDKRMREAEVNASKALLEFELSHLQVENNELREQLEKVKEEKKERKGISKTPKASTSTKASFRIRTPPRTEITGSWKTNILKLDPKSDSSESNDILVQSSGVCKSPGTALKLAAIKRMRDAGWTSISSSDKKKKKINEKIFA